jgi:hypothetical protein
MSPGERHVVSSLSGFGAIGSLALARRSSIRVIGGLVCAHTGNRQFRARRKRPSNTLFMPN